VRAINDLGEGAPADEATGYRGAEAVGNTLRFLQGPETARAPVEALMAAVRQCRPVLVRLTNYTKAGVPYDHQLSVEPLSDPSGQVRAFQATSLLLCTPGEPRETRGAAAASALPLIRREAMPPLWPVMARLVRPGSPPPPVSPMPPGHAHESTSTRRAGGRGGAAGVWPGGGGVAGPSPAQTPHELDQDLLTWLESDHPADAELEALVY
jgi:hypothetical protein